MTETTPIHPEPDSKRPRRSPRHRSRRQQLAIWGALAVVVSIPGAIVAVTQVPKAIDPPGVVVKFGLPIKPKVTPDLSGKEDPSVPHPDAFTGAFLVSNDADTPVTVLDVTMKQDTPKTWQRTTFLSSSPASRPVTADGFAATLNNPFDIPAHGTAWLVISVLSKPGTCGKYSAKCSTFTIMTNDDERVSFDGYSVIRNCAPSTESPCGRALTVWETAMASRAIQNKSCNDLNDWLAGKAVAQCSAPR